MKAKAPNLRQVAVGLALAWTLPLAAVLAAGSPSAGNPPPSQLIRFTFGTPSSATREGFTKVTAGDAFSPAKGFGFERTQGLRADDRGGSEIALPDDAYTARTYGAYRTTSDLTCAFVEGTSENAFLVAVPDGEYTVWLAASDAEWDPPLFEVWANDQKKLDVRIARARFVFLEPFQALATGGQLRIEFRGPHGWLLNGLVIGKAGPDLDAAIATLERDIFFLTEPELPNWTERKSEPSRPEPAWTVKEREAGFLVFPTDYTERITPTFVPTREAVGQPLTTLATPGEFEPATFGVTAGEDLGEVRVELSDFVADGGGPLISRDHVQVGIVRCWPQRAVDRGGKGEYATVPERIEAPTGRIARVASGETRQWWLTVHVPEDAAAGRYRMVLTLRPEKAPPAILEWRLLILPFALVKPADKHWGTWLESFPPIGGLRGPERRGRNTADEEVRLVRADLADFRNHGFDLAIFNYYFGVTENPDGTFSYDISKLGKDLDYWKTLLPIGITVERLSAVLMLATTSMLFPIALLAAPAAGPLRVHPTHPRYFTDGTTNADGSLKAVYLGGHQIFVDLQDNSFNKEWTQDLSRPADSTTRVRLLDWERYLDFVVAHDFNYLRNWVIWSTGSGTAAPPNRIAHPMPYARSGPGTASDGKPKFDLHRFDESFFSRLHDRVQDLRNRGVYVSVMLFELYGFLDGEEEASGQYLWEGNLFNRANNINGVDVDRNRNRLGEEFFSMDDPEIVKMQKAYMEKMVDTLNDLDNVLWEVCNEAPAAAFDWQCEMARHLKVYEARKAHQHLVLLSPDGWKPGGWGTTSEQRFIDSPADWIATTSGWCNRESPKVYFIQKPVIMDLDHVAPGSHDPALVWKAFTRSQWHHTRSWPRHAIA